MPVAYQGTATAGTYDYFPVLFDYQVAESLSG